MEDKCTALTPKDQSWEYRCNSCKQLRFCAGKEQPKVCGSCGSTDIVVGRPGELPSL